MLAELATEGGGERAFLVTPSVEWGIAHRLPRATPIGVPVCDIQKR